MLLPDERKPQRLKSDGLIVEPLATELMIYDQKRNQAFCLNQKAAFVWQRCDGKTTTAQIAADMAQDLNLPVDEKVVEFALATLSKDGLLEAPAFLPAASLSRRSLIQKFGVSAAMALPLVTALTVATPRAHASSKGPSTAPIPKPAPAPVPLPLPKKP